MGNNALMSRLFTGSLRGVVIDWFCALPVGSIMSWTDLEAQFLTLFYEYDIEDPCLSLSNKSKRKAKL